MSVECAMGAIAQIPLLFHPCVMLRSPCSKTQAETHGSHRLNAPDQMRRIRSFQILVATREYCTLIRLVVVIATLERLYRHIWIVH